MDTANGQGTTDDIVKRALEQEQVEKDAKKRKKAGVPLEKGKTLSEIEQDEGGVIKESLVGMAQTKRALNRKTGAVAETDLVADIEDAEEESGEEGEEEEEEGKKFEPFNLKKERETGYFDEEGNYVEQKDPDEFQDAWLDSAEAQVVSSKVRARLQEEERQLAEADKARPPSGREIATMKGKLAVLMLPGETLTATLKRLGGKRAAPKPKRRKKPVEKHVPTPEELAAKQNIETLTETASFLLINGETDVYNETKEEFERELAFYAPLKISGGGAAEKLDEDMFAGDEVDGEDMFAEDVGKDDATPKEGAKAGTSAEAAPPAPAAPESSQPTHAGAPAGSRGVHSAGPSSSTAPTSGPGQQDGVDYSTWPVGELKRFLTERGQDPSAIVEKDDLIARVKEFASQGPEGGNPVPEGYAFDPDSGYYYSGTTGMYYDITTGGFYSATDSKWYVFDADAQEFKEWATTAT